MTSAQPSRNGSVGVGAVLGVAVGGAVTAIAWMILVPPVSGVPVTSPSPSATIAESPTQEPTPTDVPTTETPPAQETPSASASSPTASGVVTSLPSGSWVTVLKSLPKDIVTPENALEQAADLGDDQHRPVVIDTDAFGNLHPGYWAVVVPGQSSREESNAVCDALGIGLGDHCYPRQI